MQCFLRIGERHIGGNVYNSCILHRMHQSLLTRKRRTKCMEYHFLGYFAKFTCPVSEVRLAKSPSTRCYLAIWLFYQVDCSCLPTPDCQIVKSTLPNCQVHSDQLSSPFCYVWIPSCQHHVAILPNCQVLWTA